MASKVVALCVVFLACFGGNVVEGSEAANSSEDVVAELGVNESAASNLTMSVLKEIKDGIGAQLHTSHSWINAVVSLLVGLLMCFEGELVFKYLLILCVALFSYLVAMVLLQSDYPDLGPFLHIVLSAEICVLFSLLAFVGFKGVKYMIGMGVGLVIAYYVHLLALEHMSSKVAYHWGFLMPVGNICVLLGVIPFSDWGKGHRRVMAGMFSFVGAGLIVSSIAYFSCVLAQMKGLSVFFAKHGMPIAIERQYWVDYFLALCWKGTKSVGIFAQADWGINTAKPFGMVWGMDRFIGRLFWLVFFILGFLAQIKLDKARVVRDQARAGAKEQAKLTAEKAAEQNAPPKKGFAMFKRKANADDSKNEPLLP